MGVAVDGLAYKSYNFDTETHSMHLTLTISVHKPPNATANNGIQKINLVTHFFGHLGAVEAPKWPTLTYYHLIKQFQICLLIALGKHLALKLLNSLFCT